MCIKIIFQHVQPNLATNDTFSSEAIMNNIILLNDDVHRSKVEPRNH